MIITEEAEPWEIVTLIIHVAIISGNMAYMFYSILKENYEYYRNIREVLSKDENHTFSSIEEQ